MLTCKGASQLMSQSFDRRLGFIEKTSLKLHLLICDSCQIAHRQLNLLHQFCKRIVAEPADINSIQPNLTAEAKERILKELHRKQDEHSTSGD